MKHLVYISLLLLFACEEVIIVELPAPQKLVVVEGLITDSISNHPIRLTRSNSFSDEEPVIPIADAEVSVQSRSGELFEYSYVGDGYYYATTNFQGFEENEYRILALIDTFEIRSEWDKMPEKVNILGIQIESFEENDPDNPGQQITIYYPKINVIDPADKTNYYRWVFFKNNSVFKEPESITIQNDRLFNGNIVPNNFQSFGYELGDSLSIELVSISQAAHSYLALLRSQITTLGTSGGTTPAVVPGNVKSINDESIQILGFFGAASVSRRAVKVQ